MLFSNKCQTVNAYLVKPRVNGCADPELAGVNWVIRLHLKLVA